MAATRLVWVVRRSTMVMLCHRDALARPRAAELVRMACRAAQRASNACDVLDTQRQPRVLGMCLVVQHFLQEDQSTVDVSIHLRPTSEWQLLNIIELIHLRGHHDQCGHGYHSHHMLCCIGDSRTLQPMHNHNAVPRARRGVLWLWSHCMFLLVSKHLSSPPSLQQLQPLAAVSTACC